MDLIAISLLNGYQQTVIPENLEIGQGVDTFTVTDIIGDSEFLYSLAPGVEDNDLFEMDGPYLITKVLFDYETRVNYSVQVTATDQFSNIIQKSFPIIIQNSYADTNLPPTDFFFYVNYPVPNNTQLRTLVGNFNKNIPNNKVIDADNYINPAPSGSQYRYALVDGLGGDDNNSYDIEWDSVLWTRTGAVFNYDEKPQHSIRVRLTDPHEGWVEKVFIINIIPSNVSLPSTSVVVTGEGKAVAAVTIDPTTVPVTINGQPLPSGSVLRNTSTGQKFVKIEGGALEFVTIEVEPKVSWGWSASGDAAWEILQAL